MHRLITHLTSPDLLHGAPFDLRLLPPREAVFAAEHMLRSACGGPEACHPSERPPSGEACHPAETIRRALKKVNISRLYSHQAEALQAISAGRNPLVVTPTASGKSLIYQIAILEELQKHPDARVLLLFPLKALEQDQLARLRELMSLCGLDPQKAMIMDGDTPRDDRDKMRADPPNLMLTNPDMLHYGILPYHRGWSLFLRGLRFIVIDELHVYRGIFGSHVLQVLRRLGRVSRFYGSKPQWIAGSATIGNPLELAQDLTGEEFALTDQSGAPASGRHFVIINPVESPYSLAARLLPEILKKKYKAIAFTKSRIATELLYKRIIEADRKWETRLSSYRAGFLPEERREIERRLLKDELSGVISTSALELGMDIGGIDVCLLLGYPGTISALMQRAGRAGRRDRESLVILIAGEDALDQYYARHSDELFAKPSEAAIVDGTNEPILRSHLICAAAEIPLAANESYLSEEKREHLPPLVEEGKLIRGAGGQRWFPGVPHPHRLVNIRSVGSGYSIHDSETGAQIGDIGFGRLWSECHPQAIYLHRARQYLIEKLDDKAKAVFARPIEVDYYTHALGEKETEIIERLATFDLPGAKAFEGKLEVTERVTGYQKRRIFSGELISTHPLDGPPQIMVTRGFWLEFDVGLKELFEEKRLHYMGGLHAGEHAMISMLPLEVMCDRGDIGGISFAAHPQTEAAAIFIYDAYPGGLGITRRAYRNLSRLIERTLSLIRDCRCDDGCPACIQSPRCGAGNRPLDKAGAKLLLSNLSTT
jgi:DEAD/DEAH box helicase domain-containing protein